jgi:hypothetical protein
VRGLLAATYYIGSSEPKHWNARALENAITPSIITRLIDGALVELMTVGFNRYHWATLIQTGYKYGEVYDAHRIDPQLRNESEQSDLMWPSFRYCLAILLIRIYPARPRLV